MKSGPISKKRYVVNICILAAILVFLFAIIVFFGVGSEKQGIARIVLFTCGGSSVAVLLFCIVYTVLTIKQTFAYEQAQARAHFKCSHVGHKNITKESFAERLKTHYFEDADGKYRKKIKGTFEYLKFSFVSQREFDPNALSCMMSMDEETLSAVYVVSLPSVDEKAIQDCSSFLLEINSFTAPGLIRSNFTVWLLDEANETMYCFFISNKKGVPTVSRELDPLTVFDDEEIEKPKKEAKTYFKPLAMKTKKTLSACSLACFAIAAILSWFVKGTDVTAFVLSLSGALLFSVALILLYVANRELLTALDLSLLALFLVGYWLSGFLPAKIDVLIRSGVSIVALIAFIIQYAVTGSFLWLGVIPLALYFLAAISIISKVEYVDENDPRLWVPAVVVAAVFLVACTIFFFTKRGKKSMDKSLRTNNKVAKAALMIFYAIGFGLIGACTGFLGTSTINYGFSYGETATIINCEIIDKRIVGGQDTTYYLEVGLQNADKEISVSNAVYYSYEIGDTIAISFYEGALGMEYYVYEGAE